MQSRIVIVDRTLDPCPVTSGPLWLVVIKGWGAEPTMLLTTRSLSRSRKAIWWVVKAYLTRWRIEKTLRFAKQTYALEDVRVLGYESLKNMMALARVSDRTWDGTRE